MCLLENGPYIRAVGKVARPDFAAVSATVPGGTVPAPVRINEDGSVTSLSTLSREDMQIPLPKECLKASGVARARNAARSTIFAALIAHDFIKHVNGLPGFDPDRVVIGVCNCSASAAISWEYETEGVTLGWEMTNTMLMPSSLPSALGTQVSSAIKTHAAAITFLDDILGMCSAFEYTHLSFFHNRADHAFIIAAEEYSTPHDKVIAHLNRPLPEARDGGAGVLLSREKPYDEAWRFALCRHLADEESFDLPEAWSGAEKMSLNLDAEATFSTLLFPYALQQLLSGNGNAGGGNKAVLTVNVPGRGSFVMGFEYEGRA